MFKILIINSEDFIFEKFLSQNKHLKTEIYKIYDQINFNSDYNLIFCDLENLRKIRNDFPEILKIGVYTNPAEKLELFDNGADLLISNDASEKEVKLIFKKIQLNEKFLDLNKCLKKIIKLSENSSNIQDFLYGLEIEFKKSLDIEFVQIQLYSEKDKLFYIPYFVNNKTLYDYQTDTNFLKKNIIKNRKSNIFFKEEIKKYFPEIKTEETYLKAGFPLIYDKKIIGILELSSIAKIENLNKKINFIEQISSNLAFFIKKKEIELRIESSDIQMHEVEKFKSSFLSNLSHEIRTPLNAIVGFSTLLNDEFTSDEEKVEYIEIINQNTNSLLQLIDDMVDLAKLEAGEIKINKTETNLNLLIKEAIAKVKKTDLYKNKKVNIESAQIDDSIYISTDTYRLMQIVLNLLTNALKFGNQKDIKIGIENLKAGIVRLFIQDFGIGIGEDEKSKIFENFRQIHQKHNDVFGGTGIGLSISKAIANLMNINLYFESEKGVGSKFFLEFSKADIKISSSSKLNLGSYFWEGKKILIAEDNESNFMYLNSLLKGSGAEITWEKDGYSALKKFKKEKNIDLILMDILMPGISGIECTKEIRKTNNEIVIIAQTAFQTQGYKQAASAAGCNEFIIKPINPKLLLNTIDAYLGRK